MMALATVADHGARAPFRALRDMVWPPRASYLVSTMVVPVTT